MASGYNIFLNLFLKVWHKKFKTVSQMNLEKIEKSIYQSTFYAESSGHSGGRKTHWIPTP